jgi:hypothetical protein
MIKARNIYATNEINFVAYLLHKLLRKIDI